MNSLEDRYEFEWLRGNTFESLSSITKGYVCCLSTELHRIILEVDGGEKFYVPQRLLNNTWEDVHAHELKVKYSKDADFASESVLKETMLKKLLVQFPYAAESFYESLPSRDNLKQIIQGCSYMYELNLLGYPVWFASVQEDKEWDGAVGIDCNNGVVLVPFKFANEEELLEEATLLHEYITFRYYNVLAAIGGFIDGLIESLKNLCIRLSWSNFKNKINGD